MRLAVYSLKDSPLSTPISTTAGEYFGHRSSVRKSSVRTITSSSAASTHGPSLNFICSSSSWCGRSEVPPSESHLPPLPISSTPAVSIPGISSVAAAVTSDKHVLDAARRRGGAGQLGHPRREIVVSRFGHDRKSSRFSRDAHPVWQRHTSA